MKRLVSNMAATVIIYRRSNPREIFLEMKDDTHPIALVRGQLCTVGGNWIGDKAKQDLNPRNTLGREIEEEWSLARATRDGQELLLLGMDDAHKMYEPTSISKLQITDDDTAALERVKATVISKLEPFGDYINTISREAMDQADPGNKRDGFSVLISYFTAGLDDKDWEILRALQTKFGNISAEAISTMTSLDEILKSGTKTAFGHDRVLQLFFLFNGFQEAEQLPLVDKLTSEPVGMPLSSYDKYLARYDVARKPA